MLAESGLTFRGWKQQTNWWTQLLPQVAYSSEAVKHGLIALSAALQTMKLRNKDAGCQLTNHIQELFTITQYNKSIHHLKQHTALSTFENLEITLVCCLIFICLETARGNTKTTQIHISNGLRIIDKLVSNNFLLYCILDNQDERYIRLEKEAYRQGFKPSRLSKNEWYHLLRFFAQFELGAALYDSRTKPSMSLRVLAMTEFFMEFVPEFRSVDDVSSATSHWYSHVFARLYTTAPHRGDVKWWADPEQKRIHERLLSWGRKMLRRLDEFTNGPLAPHPKQVNEFCSVSLLYDGLSVLYLWTDPHEAVNGQSTGPRFGAIG